MQWKAFLRHLSCGPSKCIQDQGPDSDPKLVKEPDPKQILASAGAAYQISCQLVVKNVALSKQKGSLEPHNFSCGEQDPYERKDCSSATLPKLQYKSE
jgi:hypothetical protein